MGFKCGIVGLPNVGKSTLFNALTKSGIEASNYPFCTIEPNTGIVTVPDSRLNRLAELTQSAKVIPAAMRFVDIAGLVAGASKGEGLGNKFLSHIRETQAIAHVVRCFEDDNITHVSGTVNPIEDIQTINTELAIADIDRLDKALIKHAKDAKRGDKQAKLLSDLYQLAKSQIEQELPLHNLKLSAEEETLLQQAELLSYKPTLFIANVSDEGFTDNLLLQQVEDYAAERDQIVIPVCAAIESEIAELKPDDQAEFLKSLELTEPGLNKIIRAGYKMLGLHTYFTAGPKEARAWTLPIGATAPEAAGVIHTDFAKGFIRAEVIAYDDYIQYQGEKGAKEAGKWRSEGKDYLVADGDVILFRFNV